MREAWSRGDERHFFKRGIENSRNRTRKPYISSFYGPWFLSRSPFHAASNLTKKLRDHPIIDRSPDFLRGWKLLASGADLSGWKMATLEEQLDNGRGGRESEVLV